MGRILISVGRWRARSPLGGSANTRRERRDAKGAWRTRADSATRVIALVACSASPHSRSTSATPTTPSASCRARPTPRRSRERRTPDAATRSRPRRLCGRQHASQSREVQLHLPAKCTNTAVIAGLQAAVNPNSLVVSGTASTNLVRRAVRHRPLRRHCARNACSPCSADARGHRRRHRPHGLDVPAHGTGGDAPNSTTPRTACARCWA